ncbi:N-terminal domain of NWD NACHT-NTPase [Microdochium nivale]|nr:N-terminal domain of NWD NACHT-NTPase [Microdochium nivale]
MRFVQHQASPTNMSVLNQNKYGPRPWSLDTICWIEAITKCEKEISKCSPQGSFLVRTELLEEYAKTAIEVYEPKSTPLSKVYHEIVKSLQMYCDTINVMIQHQPFITSLVWGSFRIILSISIEYHDTPAVCIEGLSFIAEHVGRWQTELRVWRESKRVQDGMVRLYASIIRFLCLSLTALKRGRLSRIRRAMFSSNRSGLNSALKEMKNAGSDVNIEARAAGEWHNNTGEQGFLYVHPSRDGQKK